MKKIPTIFIRNSENMCEILPERHPDCSWVFDGEGVATRQYDGTCCLIEAGKLWKRSTINPGKPAPKNFKMAENNVHDPLADNKIVGWVPVTDSKDDKWHNEGFNQRTFPNGTIHGSYEICERTFPDGTYELCGPKIQGNPEGLGRHILFKHSLATQYPYVSRTFGGIKSFFEVEGRDIEGIIFHHDDGRMAKIKKRDYQLKR